MRIKFEVFVERQMNGWRAIWSGRMDQWKEENNIKRRKTIHSIITHTYK